MKFFSLTQAICISAILSLAALNASAAGSNVSNAARPTLQEWARAAFGKPALTATPTMRKPTAEKSAARYAKNLASHKATNGRKAGAKTQTNKTAPANRTPSGNPPSNSIATSTDSAVTAAAITTPVTETAAIRFLEQASFGPTRAEVQRVMQIGFDAYINEQFSMQASNYAIKLTGGTVREQKHRFLYNAINGRDQLRQRMAFALGQIFVVSSLGLSKVDAVPSYQRMLMGASFGNFAQLLRKVTLHPSMGFYLDMVNNWAGEHPNENYAREVMQLFTIGTIELNLDGSPRVDAEGRHIPTYTQTDVEELARALTGWTYPGKVGDTPGNQNEMYFHGNMEPVEAFHDHQMKVLLGDVILPAGQTAQADLSAVLNVLTSHPNVAPFFSVRLIQHFVTSNPSPSYVQRVAQVFNNNGAGVRGDLKAVIKAVLLDPEARSGDTLDATQQPPTAGRLKEPAVLICGLLRALGTSRGVEGLEQFSADMGQDIFSAPSVFSYYSPEYVIPEANVNGPEFEIFTGPRIVAWVNFVNKALTGTLPHTTIDLSNWEALAGDKLALLDHIDLQLFHGTMTTSTRAVILGAMESYSATEAPKRARIALALAATAPEYLVHH